MTFTLYALLFGSGIAGLIYEVCWSRQLGLWLGHGERGAALTLALFFVGMAAGYALAARLALKQIRALHAYAVCEGLIALCALAMPIINTRGPAYLWLAIFAPTCAMGASLPFAMQAVAARGAPIARAYAWHLFGATLGSLFTSFLLIEQLGVWHSTYLAAAISFACAATAWTLSEARRSQPAREPRPALRFQLAAGWAGAATLALEVLVLRLFALTFHNSTYSFGLTVAVFIVCLALGSRSAARRLPGDQTQGTATAGRAASTAALGVACIVPLFAAVTHFGELRAPNFGSYMVLSVGLAGFVLAWPVIAAGSLLPSLWSAARGDTGVTVGALSAANSIGAALGALGASFVLLPRLGLFAALLVVAACYLTLDLWLRGTTRTTPLTLLALAGLSVLTLRSTPGSPEGYALLARWQSPYGWVDLLRKRDDDSLSARLDLHYQLGSSADRARHLRMGSLPLALHAQPVRVLFVGLATGMTGSAALSVGSVQDIEIVELIPEVAKLARRFGDFNAHLLDDPRVHVRFDDGRSFIAREGALFDVIVADLFVPWHSHAGYLYTVEHYRAVRSRLAPGGIFAQWLPLWQLGPDELALIGESMGAAFPHTSVWIDDADPTRPLLAFVGQERSSQAKVRELAGARLVGDLVARPEAARNSDEHPWLEFRAPRTERDQRLLTAPSLRAYLATHVDKLLDDHD